MQQHTPGASAPAVAPASDFDDLNALLGEAMAATKETEQAKLARERLKRGGLSAAEREADAARIADWEARHEWRAEANVALFVEITCETCNTYSTSFSHFMQRQVHRHLRDSQRWTTVDNCKADLPNEVVLQKKLTAMCDECAPAKGWLLESATTWEG